MRIAILLGTFNGAQYLEEQLESFKDQSHVDWVLWTSDDGSTDGTVSIVKEFASRIGSNRVKQFEGPRKGFAANFLHLVCNPNLKADAYAYSDQDDVWMKNKLERAAAFLSAVPANKPALYCSRTLYVDILITGAGGEVFFDKNPSVRYRQHANNLIGMNIGIRAKIGRIKMLFRGRYRDWNGRHVSLLSRSTDFFTPKNIAIFEQFSKARQTQGFLRIVAFKRSGVYRQTLLDNIAFYIAAIIGKV